MIGVATIAAVNLITQGYSALFTYLKSVVLVLGLGVFMTPLTAEQLDGLYDIAVPVNSQSSKDLQKATRAGLETLFIRVAGNAEVIQHPQIAGAIRRAKTFTRQFRYETLRDESDQEQLQVLIEFEPRLVDQALREAGLPLWSSNRPTVLVWLAVEDGQGRRFVGMERDADIVKAITENATRRGLVIKLPSLDLEDMVAVSIDDLWQLNSWRLRSAAERYQADTLLIGRVSKLTNGKWLGRWLYDNGQQKLDIDSDATTLYDYVSVAVDQVAELQASRHAIAPVNIAENGVLLRLTGIAGFVDYARAINYLESVAAVRHANVINVEGNEIIVRLVADGLLSQLQQLFALDKRLEMMPSGSYQGEYLIDLDYRWPDSGRAGSPLQNDAS